MDDGGKELYEGLDAALVSLPEHEREPFMTTIATLTFGGVTAVEIAQRWLTDHRYGQD